MLEGRAFCLIHLGGHQRIGGLPFTSFRGASEGVQTESDETHWFPYTYTLDGYGYGCRAMDHAGIRAAGGREAIEAVKRAAVFAIRRLRKLQRMPGPSGWRAARTGSQLSRAGCCT